MEEHDKRFWRNMTFAQLRNRRVRVSAYGGDIILEFRLTPGIGHTLGARQYTVNGFDIGELFHEGHDGFMELTRQKAPVSIKLLPDEPEYKSSKTSPACNPETSSCKRTGTNIQYRKSPMTAIV